MVRVAELMARLPDATTVAPSWRFAAGLELSGVTADSRDVSAGFLFAALPGSRADGRTFIADAVERGAVAVLAPPGTDWPPAVPPRPLIQDPEPRRRLAQLASLFAGPQPDVVAAVTGTNGKTSTVEFLRQIWAARGLPAASLGTLGVIAPVPEPSRPRKRASMSRGDQARGMDSRLRGNDGGGRLRRNDGDRSCSMSAGMTTPDPVQLATTLARLAAAGVRHAALEASSHGLDQFRLDGVRLAAAGFTNLTRDHLDYHGSLDAYRTAKLRLFAELLPAGAPAVVNADMDPATLAALREIAARRRLALRTVGEAGEAMRLHAAHPRPDGQDIVVEHAGTRRHVALSLPGRFQADNALLATCLAEALGEADALGRLPALAGVRGRLELAARLPNGAAAYVDYAHTPDALKRLLTSLRPHTTGRLHVVFGAGGDRDRGKRPLMGAAARLADVIIVTDDNPRSEDPAAIRAAILAACPEARDIGDRARAIEAGLNGLGPGDVLAVAGKGHEQGQTVGTTVIPFDDASVIRKLAGVT